MKKITVILLSVLMLISAIPLSVSAAEETNGVVCADLREVGVTLDGKDTEGWENIGYSLLDSVYNGAEPTEKERQSKVRIASDGKNLYVYYETYGDNFGEEPMLYVYLKTPGIGDTKRCVIIYLNDASKDFRYNQLNAEKAMVVGNELTTVEIKLPLPYIDSANVKKQGLSEAYIGILERYDKTGGGMALSEGFNWAADTRFAIPLITPEVPVVENAVGKTVNIDGEMTSDEGWASAPYMLLDSPQWGANGSDITVDSSLRFSTDGQNLYAFFTSGAEKHGSKPLLYLNLLFAGFEKPLEIGVMMTDGNTAFFRWECKDTAQAEYVSSSAQSAAQAVKVSDTGTAVELLIPLPELDRSMIKKNDVTVKVGAFERFNYGGGDTGMAPSEGFGWNAGIPITLPMINSLAIFNDVSEKKITVNGAMGSAESWSRLPYMVLGAATEDGATVSGSVTNEPSTVRYSADSKYLYVFFETENTASERLYLQFAFGGKSAGADAKGCFLNVALDITPDAEEPLMALTYGEGASYTVGDVMYDETELAVKHLTAKTCAELRIPIPQSVADERLEDAVTVMVGAYEKSSANAADGYIPTDGYNETTPTVPLVLAKDDASVREKLAEWLEESKDTADHEYLRGVSVNLFGDSYFTGGELDSGYTWAAMLATKYGWILNNYAEADDMVSSYGGIDDLPMVKRYRQLPNNAPDIVIVTGGYYDWQNNVPIGNIGSRDASTYIGALGAVIDGLKIKYPESAIVFVTPWNFSGENSLSLTYRDYAEAMEAVCEEKGVYCYKGWDSAVSAIDMQSADFRAQYCVSETDSYHLNLKGMKLALPAVETFLNNSMTDWWEDYLSEDIPDTDTKDDPDVTPPADTEKAPPDTGDESRSNFFTWIIAEDVGTVAVIVVGIIAGIIAVIAVVAVVVTVAVAARRKKKKKSDTQPR